jgi:hypothetical protein
MKRQPHLLLIASTLGLSWLAMQAVHEAGHVAAAIATGGRVADVKLHPLALSHTMLSENPRPLWVAWMGPVVGVFVPVLAWAITERLTLRGAFVVRFFAGFCLVGNGAYLAGGSFYGAGDASDLVRHGAPTPVLWLFGLATIPAGFWLWNGLGPQFRAGEKSSDVDQATTCVVTLLLLAIVVLELSFG